MVLNLWRRGEDLNLRYPFEYTHFPGVRLKPDSATSPQKKFVYVCLLLLASLFLGIDCQYWNFGVFDNLFSDRAKQNPVQSRSPTCAHNNHVHIVFFRKTEYLF